MKAYKIRTGEHYKQQLGVGGPAAGLTEPKPQVRRLPDSEVLVIIGTDASVFTTLCSCLCLYGTSQYPSTAKMSLKLNLECEQTLRDDVCNLIAL